MVWGRHRHAMNLFTPVQTLPFERTCKIRTRRAMVHTNTLITTKGANNKTVRPFMTFCAIYLIEYFAPTVGIFHFAVSRFLNFLNESMRL